MAAQPSMSTALEDGLDSEIAPGPVPELSTENSNTVREPDGSYSTEISAGPVNYEDDTGAWVPISNELVEAPGAAYAVENESNSYSVLIPENPATTPVKFEEDGAWVTMKMLGADDAGPDVDGSEATFEDVADADEVRYEATDTGVKETIVLSSAPATPPTFGYLLRVSPGITPVLTSRQTVEFRDGAGGVRFQIPAGFMYDSALPEPVMSRDVTYTLAPSGSSWRFTVIPSQSWLTDPARVYPVMIDPTVDKIVQKSCWMQEEQANTTHCGEWIVKVGANENLKKRRGLFDFNLNGIPQNAVISNATAYIWADHYSTSGSSTGTPHWALYNPSQIWKQGATWNHAWDAGGLALQWTGGGSLNQISQNTVPSNGSASGWMSWDITPKVQGWVNSPGANPNRGVMVRQTSENSRKVLGLVSERHNAAWARPLLRVTYVAPPSTPTIESVSPCVAPCWSTLRQTRSATPTISVKSTDPEGGNLTYNLAVTENDSDSAIASKTITGVSGSVVSWQIPGGVLKDAGMYDFVVSVSDGESVVWGEWDSFALLKAHAPSQPRIAMVSPCANNCDDLMKTSSVLPSFEVEVSDPDSTLLQGRVEVRRADSSLVQASPWTTVANGGVLYAEAPEGAISGAGNFEVRAAVKDHENQLTVSDWEPFAVALAGEALEPVDISVGQCGTSGTCPAMRTDSNSPGFVAHTNAVATGPRDVVFEVRDQGALVESGTVEDVPPGAAANWAMNDAVINDGEYELHVGVVGLDSIVQWAAVEPFTVADAEVAADSPAETYAEPPHSAVSDAPYGWDANYSISQASANEDLTPDPGLTGRGSDTPTAIDAPPYEMYAPRLFFHPAEKAYPINAQNFIQASSLNWRHKPIRRGCPFNHPLAYPIFEPWLSGTYSHFNLDESSCEDDRSELFRANDLVAAHHYGGPGHDSLPEPTDDPPFDPSEDGMYLDLADSALLGYGFATDEEVYWQRVGRITTYWFLYGDSRIPGASTLSQHEGDWERIAIKFKRNGQGPAFVQYFAHYGSCVLPWDKVPLINGTHPVLWVARRTHATYPAGGSPLGENQFVDDLGGDGKYWNANRSLRKLDDLPWFGYAGSWGSVSNGAGVSGPMSPGTLRWFYKHDYGGKPKFDGEVCDNF